MESRKRKGIVIFMIVGIDLGTTNSLVAYFDKDKATIIPNRLGEHLTPSVVAIDEKDTILVGKTAKEYGMLHPDRVVQVFKRTMGTDKRYKIGDREFVSEELSALILKSLKEDAQEYLGQPVTEAVISVPAYFNEKRRKATKHAGELAGLKVERIISEPTAAAVAYGLYEKEKNTRFLVFDLGGGTFDVSILELFQNILEVRAVAGDNYLGGEDFTEVLIRYFLKKTDISLEELTPLELKKLSAIAENAKKSFSDAETVTMEYIFRGDLKTVEVSTNTYEKLCSELFDKIRTPVQRSLSDAHIKLSDIDQVVLVGGGTKLPIVRTFITKLFKQFPNAHINPDEAVALGAAIQAAMKERKESVKEVILTDVCSFTLGTEVSVEKENGMYESGHFLPIIERNTIIPVSHTERVCTIHDNQTRICINVLQGESRFARNNLLLGELEIELPKNKAGMEAVDVTYTYDVNSLLEVEAKVVSTGEKKKTIIKGKENELTYEEMEERMKELSYLKVSPREQEENKWLLLRGDRMYEESTGEERIMIGMWLRDFEKKLDTGDRNTIIDARKELKSRLEELENW